MLAQAVDATKENKLKSAQSLLNWDNQIEAAWKKLIIAKPTLDDAEAADEIWNNAGFIADDPSVMGIFNSWM